MGWSLFSWLFGEKEELPPEQLVLGAELKCAYGTEHNFLIVQSDDMDINGLPEACVLDREKSVNIMSFGYCAFAFAACSMIMELEEQWENEEPQKMLSNGEEVITTKSTLLCKGCGGEIRAVTSGQDGVEAERIAKEIELIRGMEEKYPGLLDILIEPYESLYLKEGMYQAALQFLEDRVEENGGEVWILELYSDRSLKNTLITSCLEKMLTVSGIESENAVIQKLNMMGLRNGKEPGWDVHTLNKEMIEMLKPDCEDTAKKIETNAFFRWTEGHKQELVWYCESLTEFAYLGVIYSLSMNVGQAETYKQEVKVGNAKNLEATEESIVESETEVTVESEECTPTNPSAQIKGNSYDINKLQKTQPYTNPAKVSRIKEQIIQEGPNSVKPIEIRVHNGMALVVDGHHRLEAFCQLGYSRVPIIYLHESQLGKVLTDGTYYRSLQEVLDGYTISNKY